MRAAASLSVHALNVHNSQCVARHDTTLIKVEAEFLLSFCFVHEVFVDGVAVVDDTVGFVLD
jgi:hypothetical protein